MYIMCAYVLKCCFMVWIKLYLVVVDNYFVRINLAIVYSIFTTRVSSLSTCHDLELIIIFVMVNVIGCNLYNSTPSQRDLNVVNLLFHGQGHHYRKYLFYRKLSPSFNHYLFHSLEWSYITCFKLSHHP